MAKVTQNKLQKAIDRYSNGDVTWPQACKLQGLHILSVNAYVNSLPETEQQVFFKTLATIRQIKYYNKSDTLIKKAIKALEQGCEGKIVTLTQTTEILDKEGQVAQKQITTTEKYQPANINAVLFILKNIEGATKEQKEIAQDEIKANELAAFLLGKQQ